MSGLTEGQDTPIDLAALAAQGDELEQQVEEQQEEQQEEVQLSDIEQKAWDQGWRPEGDFSGDPGNWKTAKEYVKDGEWISKLNEQNHRMDKMQSDFDQRLENANKLQDARRQSELTQLKNEQRNAVSMADEEAYDAAQQKIESLEKEGKPEVKTSEPTKDQAITDWENKNSWINDVNDDRTIFAQGAWNSFVQQNPGATAQQALDHVDSKINKVFQQDNTNPRRSQPNSTENNNKKAKRTNKELTMNDLTSDERDQWSSYGKTIFKTEKAFLTAVKDTRNS